jgi:hypothetical protein
MCVVNRFHINPSFVLMAVHLHNACLELTRELCVIVAERRIAFYDIYPKDQQIQHDFSSCMIAMTQRSFTFL